MSMSTVKLAYIHIRTSNELNQGAAQLKSACGAAQISVRRSSNSSASACCTAGPSSNPVSAPQGGPLLSGEQWGNKSGPSANGCMDECIVQKNMENKQKSGWCHQSFNEGGSGSAAKYKFGRSGSGKMAIRLTWLVEERYVPEPGTQAGQGKHPVAN